jgi:hypothetical protein
MTFLPTWLGETAKGAWPVEAVTTMRQICNQAEKNFSSFRTQVAELPPTTTTPWDGKLAHLEAICQCSVRPLAWQTIVSEPRPVIHRRLDQPCRLRHLSTEWTQSAVNIG